MNVSLPVSEQSQQSRAPIFSTWLQTIASSFVRHLSLEVPKRRSKPTSLFIPPTTLSHSETEALTEREQYWRKVLIDAWLGKVPSDRLP